VKKVVDKLFLLENLLFFRVLCTQNRIVRFRKLFFHSLPGARRERFIVAKVPNEREEDSASNLFIL